MGMPLVLALVSDDEDRRKKGLGNTLMVLLFNQQFFQIKYALSAILPSM